MSHLAVNLQNVPDTTQRVVRIAVGEAAGNSVAGLARLIEWAACSNGHRGSTPLRSGIDRHVRRCMHPPAGSFGFVAGRATPSITPRSHADELRSSEVRGGRATSAF